MATGELSNGVELTVADAPESDVGLGWARIDEATRRLLGIEAEGVVEIGGGRRTVALARGLLPKDEGRGIIRIDGLIRRNARVSSGDKVVIRKANVGPAHELELAPVISEGHRMSFGQGIENFVKRGLLKRPLTKGDVVIVPGIALMGGALPFTVLEAKPEGNVLVHETTTVRLREEPFRDFESLSPEELLHEFVERVTKKVSAVLAEFGGQLASIPGKTGQKAKIVTDKVRRFLEDLRTRENP